MLFLRRTLTGFVLFAVTLGGFAWAGVTLFEALREAALDTGPERPNRERAQTVRAVEIAAGPQIPVLDVVGEVRARRSLEVRATAAGVVSELAPTVEEGGRVRAGDLLLRLDPAAAAAEVAVAQADMREAQAELADAERGIELAADDLAVAQRQAELQAQALERQTDLRARGVGSVAAVESAALAAASADQLVVSRRQAEAAAAGRIDQASARLARARVSLSEASRRLDDTEIRAEFGGTLSDVSIVEGGLVSLNEKLATLVDPEALEVMFRVSTAQFTRLIDESGRLVPATVTVDLEAAGLTLQSPGRIDRAGATVGAGQVGRLLFARLEAPHGFRPGDLVSVRIEEPPLENVARLPSRAVAPDGAVLVIGEEDRLEVASVEILRRQGDDVIVRAEELEGARVVSELTPLVGAGILVAPLEAPAEGDAIAQMLRLSPERRERLIAFIESNQAMPDSEKTEMLGQLSAEEVPAQMVERLERRIGG